MGLIHDNDEKCQVYNGEEKFQSVMEMTLGFSENPWSWSNCSRELMTRFLE